MKNKYPVVLKIIVVGVVFAVMFFLRSQSQKRSDAADGGTDNIYKRSVVSITDSCYKSVSNPDAFECMTTALDNLAAEREWKYNQLVSAEARAKYSSVGSNVMLPDDSISRLQTWYTGIESRRDAECRTKESTFYFGSGTATTVVACAVEYETRAVELLDHVYYKKIVDFGKYSGLEKFEPTDSDIAVLAESNNTDTRHCYWEGADCE